MKPDFTTFFTRGVEHFNALEFWEAHEAWEELWLVASSDLEQYLQGLIQLAAAYHHVRRGTFRGALRLFDAALRRLDAFPRDHCNLDRSEAESAARQHREWAAGVLAQRSEERLNESDFPKLRRARDHQPLVPPNENW